MNLRKLRDNMIRTYQETGLMSVITIQGPILTIAVQTKDGFCGKIDNEIEFYLNAERMGKDGIGMVLAQVVGDVQKMVKEGGAIPDISQFDQPKPGQVIVFRPTTGGTTKIKPPE